MPITPEPEGIEANIPGVGPLKLTHLVLDYTGTLSCDGVLLPGVAERLKALAAKMHITVLTADTVGTAAGMLADLPVVLQIIQTGEDKAAFMHTLPFSRTVAIGNGRNDIPMVRMAEVGIAVITPEGCAGELIQTANLVCHDICAALELLLKPLRLTATLRN